jgi:integrase
MPKAKTPKHEYLDAGEVNALAGAVPARYRALVLTLSLMGLRIGEASFLRVGHVDVESRTIDTHSDQRKAYRCR